MSDWPVLDSSSIVHPPSLVLSMELQAQPAQPHQPPLERLEA